MEAHDVDVAVVGAGLAGLTAASELTKAGATVAVLESRHRVGGRTVNQDLGNGKVVEMGGQWIGPTQDRMYAVANELELETFPTYNEGDEVALIGGRRRRYSGELPRLNPAATVDLVQGMLRLERLARRVETERPWDSPKATAWDGQTFETWLRSAVKTRTARSILDAYVSTILAAETRQFSLLHALFYIRSGTSFEVLAGIEGAAQQDRFVGGSQLVSIRLADALGDAVLLDAPVTRVIQDRERVRVDASRIQVTARRVVIAIPPTLAGRIAYEPSLPGLRDQLMQRLPQGTMIKVNVVYDKPFWRQDGLKGLAAGPDHLVTFTVDNSPPGGEPGVLAGFVKGNNARRLAAEPSDARRKLVLDCLVEFFGPRAGLAEAYHELDWTAEPWTRGCFGAHFPPGVWTQYGRVLREPVGAIHWAGTETASVWNGYMDGAVRSGERAAREVLEEL